MAFLSYPQTQIQHELWNTATELADLFAQRAAQYDWEGRFPVENFADLHQAKYLTLTIPQELGGYGASLLDVTLALFRLAQGDGSTALVTAMHLMHLGKLLEERTTYPPLLERICRDVVEQGAMINSAVSEPQTGSPSRGGLPTTVASRQPDGTWRLNGRKTFTTGSHALHYFIVGCAIKDERAENSEGKPARGNFLVHRSQAGVSIKDTWNMLGMRGTGSNDLILENVEVAADTYVDQAIPALMGMQPRQGAWWLPIAAVYLGIAQAARDEALRFARSRRPNSLQSSIVDVPHIQEKIAKMDLALLQARAVLFGVAEQYCQEPASVHPSIFGATKHLVTNQAVEIVDLAMRLVGAASLALSSPLQRYYRDVRAGLHNPPMDDVALAQMAKAALDN